MKTKKQDKRRFVKIWPAVVCMTLFMAAALPCAWAKGPLSPLPGGQTEKRLVNIVDKSPDYNYIFVPDRRFKVSPSADILDYRGRRISLRDLLVPCSAYVTIQMFGDTRDPLVHKIQVR